MDPLPLTKVPGKSPDGVNEPKLKETEIRPADLMRRKEWAVNADREFLLSLKRDFVHVECPACGFLESRHWADKDGFSYRECSDCGTIYTSPRPGPAILEEFYRQSQNYQVWNSLIFPATEHARRERIFVPRARRTLDLCRTYGVNSGTLLEIGSAFGTFCSAIRDENFFDRIIAVEPTPGLAQTCREKGFETYEQTVEKLSFPVGTADLVAAFEVIEHLFSPVEFMRRVSQFLRPGGLLICSCPNGAGLGTLAFHSKAKTFDHEHLNYFNTFSVSKLLKRCALELVEVLTPGLLDVDLILNQIKEDTSLKIHCPLLKAFLERGDDLILGRLQALVAEARLSSHLWFVARKP